MGPRRPPTHAGDRLTKGGGGVATAVYVTYRTPRLDLAWIPDDAAIVVVHNDRSLDPAAAGHAHVTHVLAEANEGFGAGVNLALPRVETPVTVLVNPDMALTPEHWDALSGASSGEVVILPVDDSDGQATSVVNRYPSPLETLLIGYRVGRFFPRQGRLRARLGPLLGRGGADHVRSLRDRSGEWPLADYWFSAAACAVGTECLRAVGGFDPGYFLYFEDVDLAGRLAARFPAMTVRMPALPPAVHEVGGSAGGQGNTIVEQHRLASARRYAASHDGLAWRLAGAALGLRRIR